MILEKSLNLQDYEIFKRRFNPSKIVKHFRKIILVLCGTGSWDDNVLEGFSRIHDGHDVAIVWPKRRYYGTGLSAIQAIKQYYRQKDILHLIKNKVQVKFIVMIDAEHIQNLHNSCIDIVSITQNFGIKVYMCFPLRGNIRAYYVKFHP